MRTLDTSRRGAPLRRDLQLLGRMASMLFGYLTVGARLRREYRRKERKGQVLFLDAMGPTRHRETPLHRR